MPGNKCKQLTVDKIVDDAVRYRVETLAPYKHSVGVNRLCIIY
jgi:hypothetical protein